MTIFIMTVVSIVTVTIAKFDLFKHFLVVKMVIINALNEIM